MKIGRKALLEKAHERLREAVRKVCSSFPGEHAEAVGGEPELVS
ncbi:MAG TPA: hypothetical protein VNA27_02390 [Rubrobacteraceae bacterium]|nr:hypothetical protein [Rubrobacteraceae bacterium]